MSCFLLGLICALKKLKQTMIIQKGVTLLVCFKTRVGPSNLLFLLLRGHIYLRCVMIKFSSSSNQLTVDMDSGNFQIHSALITSSSQTEVAFGLANLDE